MMNRARAITKAANRRLWIAATIRAAGRCVSIAALGGLALVAADRLFALGLPVWTLIAAPLALGAAAAGYLASRARARAGDASIVLDHALGLRDRISSSLAFERAATNGHAPDPFLELAHRAADDAAGAAGAAGSAGLRRAIPLRFDNWWLAAPLAAAGLVLAAMFTPVIDILGAEQRRVEQVALEERREETSAVIEQVKEELREARASRAADAATPEQLEALDELERELAQGDIDPDDARAKAASRLDELAQNLDDVADRDDRALDALGERFASLDERAGENTTTKPLEDALRRGDWERAAEALEQLQREIARDSSIDDAQRERIANDLRDLSRALDQAAAAQQPSGSDAPEPPSPDADDPAQPDNPPENPEAFDDLRERGVPADLARDLADAESAEDLRDALEEQGMPPEQADQLAERIAQENRARADERRAEQDLRDLSRALDQAANDALDPPPPPPSDDSPPPTPSPSQTPPDEQPRPGESSDPESRQQPSDQQRTPAGADNRPENQREPSSTESEKDPGAQQRNPQQGPAQDVGSDQGDENTAADEQGRQVDDAQRPDGEAQQATEDAPGSSKDDAASPSSQPSPDGAQQSERQASGQGAAQDSPNQTPGGNADQDAPDSAQPGAMDGPAPEGDRSSQGDSNSGAARALDKVRELAQRRSAAEQSREEAQRLRERAEEMLSELSPEEREQVRRLAEQIAREQGAPTEDLSDALSETVDARRPDRAEDDGRVIAEWLSDGRAGEPNDARGAVDPRRRLTEAAQGAQRAIEEQQTPARYADLIRRYFKRLPDAVERSNAPPAPNAPDVSPSGDPG